MKDVNAEFLPSTFPRIAAAFFVLMLIGSLALACVGGIALIGPMFTRGDMAAHAQGKIIAIGPGMDFVLETTSGQRLDFQCGDQCRASLEHMQRHLHEHALTDVYYIQGPDKSMMALNVD